MNIELIREQWAQYEKLLSSEGVAKVLALPESFLGEKIGRLVANIELASDGPVVKSVLFFSESYIGEARLSANENDFDIALKNTVTNYRFSLGSHVVIRNAKAIEQAKAKGEPIPDPDKLTYQKGKIDLQHATVSLVTQIHYFGNNRDEWLRSMISAVPIDILKRSNL